GCLRGHCPPDRLSVLSPSKIASPIQDDLLLRVLLTEKFSGHLFGSCYDLLSHRQAAARVWLPDRRSYRRDRLTRTFLFDPVSFCLRVLRCLVSFTGFRFLHHFPHLLVHF